MTDNTRALLEQALESMCWAARTLNIDPDEAPNYHRSLENIRAELAKPATAPKASAFIRERAQLEQEWCVLKGTQQQYKTLPAWHDAPTCAGLWLCNYGILEVVCINQPDVDNFDDFYNAGGRWYGPIPQDAKAEGDAIKKGG